MPEYTVSFPDLFHPSACHYHEVQNPPKLQYFIIASRRSFLEGGDDVRSEYPTILRNGKNLTFGNKIQIKNYEKFMEEA